jgi:FkbH-like protein
MKPDMADPAAVETIAIASTFTAEPVEETLRFWMEELQIPGKVSFAPFNQVFQQLVDPASRLANNRKGINVLIVRLQDLADARGFLPAMRTAVERAQVPYLVCFCPGEAAAESRFDPLEHETAEALRALPGVQVVTSAELAAAYPVADTFDPAGEGQAHVPYTPAFFTALGTMIARRMYAAKNAPYKVIAVDADQTLWNGVCGEDGPAGVGIDASRRALQEFLVRQHDAGMILCLCSRNNEGDVSAVFARPDMVLRREHFAGWRVNWNPKSESLRSLSGELKLALESFIFGDDDVVSCAEVEANCPEVLTFAVPPAGDVAAAFLARNWAFDHAAVTKEASDRTTFYLQEAERREFETDALTLKDFISGLRLKIEFIPIGPEELPRIAELTHRTNQFNATTIRRSEAALRHLLGSGARGIAVRVGDRFGDYGVVGSMIFDVASDAVVVDTFLLSCRALGRGVEHRMVARLGEIAVQDGVSSVEIPCIASGKNQPVLDFLHAVGAGCDAQAGERVVFRFAARQAAATRFDPSPTASLPVPKGPVGAAAPADVVRARVDARAKSALLSSIATNLWDAEQVAALIAGQRVARPDLEVPYVEPTTDTEKRLAGMFSALLGVERIGVHDDFFSLGGQSLFAMMLINRVRDAFGVELPITVLFDEAFTVAALSRTINRIQALSGPERAPDALKQSLDAMSDDEVRALLPGGKKA